MTAKEANEVASGIREGRERNRKEQLAKDVAPLIESVRESVRYAALDGAFGVTLKTINHATHGEDEEGRMWVGEANVAIHPNDDVFIELVRILTDDGFNAEIGISGLYVEWGPDLAATS
jgi:hypothetical protein